MDGLFFMLAVLVFIIASMFGYYVWSEVSPEITADMTDNNSIAAMNQVSNDFPGMMNGAMIFVFIGFWVFVLISAFMSTEHPVMFAIIMVLMAFLLMISMYMSNAYQDIMSDAEFISLTTTFSIPHWIMTHFLQLNLAIFLLGLIIAIGKNKYEG